MYCQPIKNLFKQLEKEHITDLLYSTYGWVRTVRSSSKTLSFCNINDGTNVSGLQIVLTDEYLNEKTIQNFNDEVKTGSYLFVIGKIVESPASEQKYEMKLFKYSCNGHVDDKYPFSKSRMNLDTLRNYIHLRPRTNVFGSIFRIRSTLMKSVHDFYHNEGFLHLDPNVITINECEGGAGVFQLTEHDLSHMEKLPLTKDKKYDWEKDHFNQPAYLTVSSQLHLEALACGLGNVYTMNKSFRSEHSSTSKHVSEFTHLEIEMIHDTFKNLMNSGERCIKNCIKAVLDKNMDDIKNLNKFISKGLLDNLMYILDTPFIEITYTNLITEINKDIKDKKVKLQLLTFGDDLSSEHENYITKKHNTGVFVTYWPKEIKSFYMKQMHDNTCQSFDLLMPYGIGELIGGSQREENYEKLINMMKLKNVPEEGMEFYTDLRKYGTCPHGGFGMGFDRLLMMVTGMKNIKDVIPFPVYYKSCKY